VGDVPAVLTEAQLYIEFERFGEVEGLKVVTQRTRRFAFVTFASVEQAVSAKQRMAKLGQWRSAISFAHKESNSTLQQEDQQQSPHLQHSSSSGRLASKHPSTAAAGGASRGGGGDEHGRGQGAMRKTHSGAHLDEGHHAVMSDSAFAARMMVLTGASDTSYGRPSAGSHGPAPFSNAVPCSVLVRLCDDTYVPTQPWPIDFIQDLPYCNACVAQLQQFGGGTSVSKLRGLLRNRLAASSNIKSVPLKAMIAAYPNLFVLRGNHVSLSSQSGMIFP
jgi:hypothetical protein